MIVQRILAIFRHARDQTLTARVNTEFKYWFKRLRCKFWKYYSKYNAYFDISIGENVYMRLYTDDELSRLIYCKGHEYIERQFTSTFLRTGDIFIDVGANTGLYTLLASTAVGINGKVYAFEPSPNSFKRLKENVLLYSVNNVECIEAAISDSEGEMQLSISNQGYSAWDTLASDDREGITDSKTVIVTTLDKFIVDKKLEGKITMIKIDIEGWETYVLSGGIKTLSNSESPLLQIEFTDKAAVAAGSSCQNLYEQVQELGYQICVYNLETNQLQPDLLRKEYPYVNLYAVKNIDLVNQRLMNDRN